MDITIDTTHPLNDRDRAILQALLAATPSAPTPASAAGGHQAPAHRSNSAEGIMSAVAGAASPRKTDGAITSARLPVAAQPGVSFTESTAESDAEPG